MPKERNKADGYREKAYEGDTKAMNNLGVCYERGTGVKVNLGMVNQHKHLLKPGDQCIGGGYYHFDFVSNRIILDRESYDFGRPKWHLLEVLKVPSTYRGMRIVYKYDDGFHDDFNVSEELPIEYYDCDS